MLHAFLEDNEIDKIIFFYFAKKNIAICKNIGISKFKDEHLFLVFSKSFLLF